MNQGLEEYTLVYGRKEYAAIQLQAECDRLTAENATLQAKVELLQNELQKWARAHTPRAYCAPDTNSTK